MTPELAAAREATDASIIRTSFQPGPMGTLVAQERRIADAEIERLTKEVKDHAEWADAQMKNPSSEAYIALTNKKLDLEANIAFLTRQNEDAARSREELVRQLAERDKRIGEMGKVVSLAREIVYEVRDKNPTKIALIAALSELEKLK